MMRTAIIAILAMFGVYAAQAQTHVGVDPQLREAAGDSLQLHHEWWLGVVPGLTLGANFGSLTVNYISSEVPGEKPLQATTSGGWVVGVALAGGLEYRPFSSKLSYYVQPGVELRWSSSYSTQPVSNGIFAYNAEFETQNTVLYGTVGAGIKYEVTAAGTFVFGGFSVDVPIGTLDSYVWQHEIDSEGRPTNQPGGPQTSIKFATQPSFATRIGLQIGMGQDMLVGLFGYQGQIITPYILIQGGTPTVTDPTSWNSILTRIGVMWRTGM